MKKRLVAVIAVTGLLLAACGDDDDGSSATTDAATEDTATSDAPATTEGAATTDAPAATSEGGADTTAAATEDTGAALPEDADPEGVAKFAYDLAAASRGGFKWDPSSVTVTTTDVGIYSWVYGTLMRPNSEGELVPDLAESVEATDANTVEIVVRDGLTTSDGTPVDGEMVKTILEGNLAKAANPAYRPAFYSAESVEVTDNTVTVNIPDGTAASWADTFPAGNETIIVPPGTNFDAPIGAGPFMVAAYTAGQTMTLEKNPEYWDADSINVAGIELTSIPPDNPQAASGALNAGQVDWTRLNFAIIDAVSGDGEVVIDPDPQYLTQILVCKSSAPLDDVNVRKALNLATDREAINEALFRGEGSPAWDLWPEGHPLHNDELTDFYAHDPEAAAALLAEAGVADLTVDIIPIPAAGGPEIAQIMQQQWAEAGVTMNIVRDDGLRGRFPDQQPCSPRTRPAVVSTAASSTTSTAQVSGTSASTTIPRSRT